MFDTKIDVNCCQRRVRFNCRNEDQNHLSFIETDLIESESYFEINPQADSLNKHFQQTHLTNTNQHSLFDTSLQFNNPDKTTDLPLKSILKKGRKDPTTFSSPRISRMRSPLHLHQLSIQPVRSQSLIFKSNWQHQPQPKQYVTFLTHQQPIQQEKSSLDRCDSFPLELDANNLISPNQQQQFNSNSIGYRLQTASPRRHRLPVQLLPNFFFTNQQRIKHQQNINKYDHFLPNLHQYSQFTSNISLTDKH